MVNRELWFNTNHPRRGHVYIINDSEDDFDGLENVKESFGKLGFSVSREKMDYFKENNLKIKKDEDCLASVYLTLIKDIPSITDLKFLRLFHSDKIDGSAGKPRILFLISNTPEPNKESTVQSDSSPVQMPVQADICLFRIETSDFNLTLTEISKAINLTTENTIKNLILKIRNCLTAQITIFQTLTRRMMIGEKEISMLSKEEMMQNELYEDLENLIDKMKRTINYMNDEEVKKIFKTHNLYCITRSQLEKIPNPEELFKKLDACKERILKQYR